MKRHWLTSSEQGAIQNVYWRIRSIAPGTTGLTVKTIGYSCQVPSWGGRQRMPKQIRNRNIRITPTGLKWNGISVGASAAMDWDVS